VRPLAAARDSFWGADMTGQQFRGQLAQPNAVKEPFGKILSVSGSKASIGLLMQGRTEDARATVANFVMVRGSCSALIGLITDVSLQTAPLAKEQGYHTTANIDLMGEIKVDGAGAAYFQRGVTNYPAIGDPASLISGSELQLIYNLSGSNTINIGHLYQDSSIPACINADEMLSKHFALFGTSGVGKSSGIVIILQQLLEARPDLRVFLLDVHNEYGQCFGDQALVLNPRNLKLPFWLFNFEEIVDVFFDGRPGVDDEVEILSEAIPLAKSNYLRYQQGNDRSVKKGDGKNTAYTADTPVPYLLADLIALIDERMGKLENRSSRIKYHKLLMRIESVRNDPRYTFMFENANVGGDTMTEVLSQLFQLLPNGRRITIMQLAGFPAEVVDAVVSVLGRMAFELGLWSDGAIPLLFVCEETHRYASADRSVGFGPTRRAISRIAKEGRKYGVFLGLVSQRPAELDPTIVSQCSTLFVMRLANDRDQEILRSAVSDAASNLLSFVPTLSTREVLAFGEGAALPTRLKFKDLPRHLRPNSEAVANSRMDAGRIDKHFIASVVERWRGAMMTHKPRLDETMSGMRLAESPTLQPAVGLDPDRFKILKKPAAAQAEAAVAPQREAATQR
jgi:DNA helicase HerA-like ATPase